MKQIKDLKGLGEKTAKQLNSIGITNEEQLKKLGSVAVYYQLSQQQKVSLNFLYALEGAITDQHWRDVARKGKARLLHNLEALITLEVKISEKTNHEN